MISRIEFYSCMIIIAGIFIFSMHPWEDTGAAAERARIQTRDSIIQVQKDSALARAMKFELKSDSLQALLNRKKLDLNIIRKKVEDEKKAMLRLSVDSTLSFFQRSVAPH